MSITTDDKESLIKNGAAILSAFRLFFEETWYEIWREREQYILAEMKDPSEDPCEAARRVCERLERIPGTMREVMLVSLAGVEMSFEQQQATEDAKKTFVAVATSSQNPLNN